MKGSIFKRCACRGDDGKQLGARCTRLRRANGAWDSRHGTWAFRVDLPRRADGRRHELLRGGFGSREEAERALASASARIKVGGRVDDRETVGAYLDAWLVGRRRIREGTYRSYEGHIRNYLTPALGAERLERLNATQIGLLYARMSQEEVSPATIARVHATLRKALNDAVRAQRLPFNPATHVELPAQPAHEVRPWEAAELGRFLDATERDRLGSLYEVLAMTGIRRGEALGLRWQDVDLDKGVLRIRQQLVDSGRAGVGPSFGPPKTRSGEGRIVDLDTRTAAVLMAHDFAQQAEREKWAEAYVDRDLVFCREDGQPLRPEYATRHMQDIARTAGLRPIRLHDLRHGAASLMLAAGVPIAVVSKRLGHSSINITADTYSHLLDGVGRSAAEAAAGLVPRGSRADAITSAITRLEHEPSNVAPAGYAQVKRGAPSGT